MVDHSAMLTGFTFSQTSLQDYADCPRRFQLRYLDRLAWPAIEVGPVLETERRQQEGQLFHRLVHQHRLGLPAEKIAALASSPNINRWWVNYITHDLKITSWNEYTELTISAPVGSCRLMAKFDLLAVKNGKALIFDWKTYHKRPRDEWISARLQTRVYRSLLIQAGASLNNNHEFDPDLVEMVYWYADFPDEPSKFPYSLAQFKRDWDGLTALINEIANHRVFPLTDDEKKCTYCIYRSYCNRGIVAGEGDDLESDLVKTDMNFEQIQEIAF